MVQKCNPVIAHLNNYPKRLLEIFKFKHIQTKMNKFGPPPSNYSRHTVALETQFTILESFSSKFNSFHTIIWSKNKRDLLSTKGLVPTRRCAARNSARASPHPRGRVSRCASCRKCNLFWPQRKKTSENECVFLEISRRLLLMMMMMMMMMNEDSCGDCCRHHHHQHHHRHHHHHHHTFEGPNPTNYHRMHRGIFQIDHNLIPPFPIPRPKFAHQRIQSW